MPGFCCLYPLSLRSETHELAHTGLALFKFKNETLEILNSAELKISAATVTHEHSKRNVFDSLYCDTGSMEQSRTNPRYLPGTPELCQVLLSKGTEINAVRSCFSRIQSLEAKRLRYP